MILDGCRGGFSIHMILEGFHSCWLGFVRFVVAFFKISICFLNFWVHLLLCRA